MSEHSSITYREKLSIEEILFRQIDRKNRAASFDHGSSVITELNNLPATYRQIVKDESDRYTSTMKTLVFKKKFGHRLGAQDNPLVYNASGEIGLSRDPGFSVKRLEDNTIDWSDPNIISPKLVEEGQIDYHEMDAVIMENAEFAKLTYNIDTNTLVAGKVTPNGIVFAISSKPTPYIPERDEPDEHEENETEPEL